ncbi:MAG: hypothetical protein JSV62_01740 [Promethearchaeota archaeon]|nr:MAG: hypothetical protein JSV62_01740 [Candidatus Lokiarchaeota archaeon]
MGFKKVDYDELRTKRSPNFLGIPIRESGKVVQKSHREKKIQEGYTGSTSEVLILNEEFMEFHYQNDGKRKGASGNGNITIFNNSIKDRIWDANLQFSGSQFDNQNEENNMNLGIFEPSSNKVLKYEIVNSENLPDLIKLTQDIENLNENIKITNIRGVIPDTEENYSKKNFVLLMSTENKVRFTINIENVSNSILSRIEFKKFFVDNFYDIEFKCDKTNEFKISKNSVECNINDLNPGERVTLTIIAKIYPKKKENIKTGKIELTFNLLNKVISGVKINHFSAYSHAMHAIKKEEKDDAPNHWQCSLFFENHSEFKMKLKSIQIFNKTKSKKIIDLDFNTSGTPTINPRGRYTTNDFDFVDEKEPTFSRKVEYTVNYKTQSNSRITSKFEESFFNIAKITFKKELSDQEIQSFEEVTIDSKITINNNGTFPVKGIQIIEVIPEDFMPSNNISDYELFKSSGKLDIEDVELTLTPDDDDPSHKHTIELNINLKNGNSKSVILVNDFLELKYPLKAITPDYKKAYDFPLKINSFYSKYNYNSEKNIGEYYAIIDDLTSSSEATLKVSHKRRQVIVGKEIFPGRNSDEFAIYIIAKNGSNIKLSDVNIKDTFPDSFELISSNIEHKLSKSKKNGEQTISFVIDYLLPYQEREIMYYLKNLSGRDVSHSELESFFVG